MIICSSINTEPSASYVLCTILITDEKKIIQEYMYENVGKNRCLNKYETSVLL